MAKSKAERGVTRRGVVVTRPHLADLLSVQVDTISKLDSQGLFDGSRATDQERDDANINANHKNCYWSKVAIEAYYTYNPITQDHAVLLDAKTRREEAETIIAEVKAAQAINEVANLDDIIRITGDSLTIFKEGVLGISSSVSVDLVVCETPEEMRDVINREAKNVLAQLSANFSKLRDNLGEYDED